MDAEHMKRLEASAARAAKLMSFCATVTGVMNQLNTDHHSNSTEGVKKQHLGKFRKALINKAADTLIDSQEDFKL